MKRRVCETCHFFQATGLGNSGWCRHPGRQFSTDVRLVVRGNEIACRNGWDADLWVPAGIEPGEPGGPLTAVDPGDPPALTDQLTSIVPARFDVVQEVNLQAGEDVVVQHSPYQGYAGPEKDARELVTNPRAAILRAREQFRDRRMREGRLADRGVEPPLLEPTADDGAPDVYREPEQHADSRVSDQENAPFLARGAGSAPFSPSYVPPVSRAEIQRPYPAITDFPEDAARFESIPDSPPVPPVASPFEETVPEPSSELDPFDDVWDDDYLLLENGHSPRESLTRRPSFLDRFRRVRHERSAPFPEDFDMPALAAAPASDHGDHAPRVVKEQRSGARAHGRDRTAAGAHEAPVDWMAAPETGSLAFDSEFDVAPIPGNSGGAHSAHSPLRTGRSVGPPKHVDLDSELRARRGADLPRWGEIEALIPDRRSELPPPDPTPRWATNLPRLCRTCRSFRPADSDERGWCTNSWAFKHQRMVDADTLACGSILGDWWTAHDGIWQRSSDVSRHALETPLLDRLLENRYASRAMVSERATGRRR
jgi:hypothetical protein